MLEPGRYVGAIQDPLRGDTKNKAINQPPTSNRCPFPIGWLFCLGLKKPPLTAGK